MKNDIYTLLKFRLGRELGELEYDIIPVPPLTLIENQLSLESFEYFGEDNEVLGFKAKHIFLYYNADILMRVKMIFGGNVVTTIKHRLEEEDIDFQDSIMFLKLYLNTEENQTVLLYQSKTL